MEEYLPIIKGFSSLECSGNSYSLEACRYLAEVIDENADQSVALVDYSDMFTNRDIEDISESIDVLIESISQRNVE